MNNEFIFEYSNYFGQTDSPALCFFIKDLFKGSKHYSESDVNGNRKLLHTNAPLIKTGKDKLSIRDQVFMLISEELTGFAEDDVTAATRFQLSTFVNFEFGAKDNTVGRKIFSEFIQDPDRITGLTDRHVERLFRTEGVTADKDGLSAYLAGLRDSIITVAKEDGYNATSIAASDGAAALIKNSFEEQSKKTFDSLLAKKQYAKLISRVIVSIIIGNLYETGDYKEAYGLKEAWLLSVWMKAENSELNSYINVSTSAYLSLKDSYICALEWFYSKEYEKSFGLLERLINRSQRDFAIKGDASIKSNLIYLYAVHLLNGYGCHQDVEEALRQLTRCISLHPNEKAHYTLACCYDGAYGITFSDPELYARHLQEASRLCYTQAMLDLAEKCINSKEFYITLCQITKVDQVDRWEYAKGLLDGIKKEDCPKSQQSLLYYLFGLVYEHQNDLDRAQDAFKRSYESGNRDAYKKIRYKKKNLTARKEQWLNDAYADVSFLTNSVTGTAAVPFIDSLTESSRAVYSTDSASPQDGRIIQISNIRSFIEETGISHDGYYSTDGKRHVAFFFSDNEERNLFDTLELLDLLYNTVIEKEEQLRCEIIDSFEIFLKCDYDYASLFIDANLNDMLENTYFKVHICDPLRDSAHQLLYEAPLFIPYIRSTSPQDRCNVIIFGTTRFAQKLAKEIVALGYMGEDYPVTVTLLGKDAQKTKNAFFADKPGLRKLSNENKGSIYCIIPEFREIDPSGFNPNDPTYDEELKSILSHGNYFVVDIGSDQENIHFAIMLRRELLKSVTDMDRTPMIAVRCRDMRTAYLAGKAPLLYTAQGNHFSNRYDLHFFGMSSTLFSYSNLVTNNYSMEKSRYIHCSYDEEFFKANKRIVYKDFYSYQYNRDSSLITALGLRYRLFCAGLHQKSNEPSFSDSRDRELAEDYRAWLASDRNVTYACSVEQSRWNGFMLSRGWEIASLEQVRAYIKHSPDRQHKHLLAKLHPFICNWEDFDEDDKDTLLFNLQKEFGKDNIKSPKLSTLKSVFCTPDILLKGNGDILDEDLPESL